VSGQVLPAIDFARCLRPLGYRWSLQEDSNSEDCEFWPFGPKEMGLNHPFQVRPNSVYTWDDLWTITEFRLVRKSRRYSSGHVDRRSHGDFSCCHSWESLHAALSMDRLVIHLAEARRNGVLVIGRRNSGCQVRAMLFINRIGPAPHQADEVRPVPTRGGSGKPATDQLLPKFAKNEFFRGARPLVHFCIL